jgi:hypothetical protein
VLAVTGTPALAGLAWGWQVQRDGTLLWAVLLHTSILMGNSFFT